MPITPLHLGVLAPINHYHKGKVSIFSFTLINLWMDGSSILYATFGLGDYNHGPESHSFLAALILAIVVSLLRARKPAWVLGAFIGGLSHVSLDMLVHVDMTPFYPLLGNPVPSVGMEPVSLVLLVLTSWLIAQYVSYSLDWVQRWKEGHSDENSERACTELQLDHDDSKFR